MLSYQVFCRRGVRLNGLFLDQPGGLHGTRPSGQQRRADQGLAGTGHREAFIGTVLPQLPICRIQYSQSDTGLQGLFDRLCGLSHRMRLRSKRMERQARHEQGRCQLFQSLCAHRPILCIRGKTRKSLAATLTTSDANRLGEALAIKARSDAVSLVSRYQPQGLPTL